LRPVTPSFLLLSEAYKKAGRAADALKALEMALQGALQTPGYPPEGIQQMRTNIALLQDSISG
jgi:hypothetical protein